MAKLHVAYFMRRLSVAGSQVVHLRKADHSRFVILTSTDRSVTMLASYARTDYDSLFLERLWFSSESDFLFSVKSSLSFLCLLHRTCMIHLFVFALPFPAFPIPAFFRRTAQDSTLTSWATRVILRTGGRCSRDAGVVSRMVAAVVRAGLATGGQGCSAVSLIFSGV